MAENYVLFSFTWILPAGSNADKVAEIYSAPWGGKTGNLRDDSADGRRFELVRSGNKAVIIYADESGDIEHVVNFIQEVSETILLEGTLQIEWAETCSKMRPGEFGGGAVLIDLTGKHAPKWMNTTDKMKFD